MNSLVFIMALASYFVGSIPTGYWLCKFFFLVDVRQQGSGNIGATNVFRALGSVRYFILVFLIDATKAYFMLAVADYFLTSSFLPIEVRNYLLLFAIILLLGNAHSVFMKMKGGKGVATTVGVISYLIPNFLLIVFIASWVGLLAVTKQMFIASLGATFMLTASYWMLFFSCHDLLAYFLIFICYWLTIRHIDNVRRFFSVKYH
jgi:acyl phosphate:glycerol-3-phosphate acyltransferase